MTTQQPRTDQRPVWIAIFLLAAAVLGIMAGFLAYASGVNTPAAVLAGGGTFGTATLLFLALAHYATGSR
jgi:hypothetical protein